MESILTSIKKLLGIPEECADFDIDLIIHINSVFLILNQIGVGPKTCFSISSDEQTWKDFVGESKNYDAVKSYMYTKVKVLFDSSTASSTHLDALKSQGNELEWRLNLEAESETEV